MIISVSKDETIKDLSEKYDHLLEKYESSEQKLVRFSFDMELRNQFKLFSANILIFKFVYFLQLKCFFMSLPHLSSPLHAVAGVFPVVLLWKSAVLTKKLCVIKIVFSYRKVSIWKQLAWHFFMSHPPKNCFLISTFLYLDTIWSYFP